MVETFLYYGWAINSTMIHALYDIASTKSKRTQTSTWKVVQYFLNYAASKPDAKIIFQASNML